MRIGGKWLHLRICLTCGHVGCCDDSPNRQARAHAQTAQHPIVRSLEPGEDWNWCYIDQMGVRSPVNAGSVAVRQRASDRTAGPWAVLVVVCFAQFMVVLDATIVNVALPTIEHGLSLSASNLQWVINAYSLTLRGFLLLGGRAGDILGRKRI